MNRIEALVASMPFVKELFREDVSLAVYDREKVLFWSDGKAVKLGLQAGDALPEEDRDFKPLKDGKERSTARMPAERFGVPVDVVCIPVKDENDEVAAILSIRYSMENQRSLESLMTETEATIDNLLGGIRQVAAHSEQLTASVGEILHNSQQAVENSSGVASITQLIREISEQTNLLGLNAAIEAARVGEAGAGFGVVAKEVRKLADNSKQAAGQIEESLASVKASIAQMESDIGQIAAASTDQAKLVMAFMSSIEQLKTTSGHLKAFVDHMLTHGMDEGES
ncbi:hypothetical protein GXP70_21335 [Paenibacillus lycopersici]|uniref:Methyl-accepting transducer domain-containing protein n=1 Tax=Paenibacillus lycopersici TaxID=2704462 RepID=A0A6C0G3E5_9BACL|nr:methyl-accepting chemotaxis protein [Paenibacillus lycopersici]QHT62271.1 hypothetical protein GXP70_21335 [Paenibacillus lycopersici]